MKSLMLVALMLIGMNSYADTSTAFLVVRVDIEDTIKKIDASKSSLDKSLQALTSALSQLKSYKDEVFAPAFQSIAEDRPLNGLTLTRVHSYLKIHFLILERGLALADYAAQIQNTTYEKAMAQLSLSMLDHTDVYLENDRLRNLLDKKDEAYEIKARALKKAYARLVDKKVEKNVKKSIEENLIDEATAAALKDHRKDWKKARKAFRGDFWQRLKTFVVHHISGGIGNMAGSVKFRKGMMWEDTALENSIVSMLEPMDIITERTPFILTDKLIPGHFGHNALWLGTEEQLKSLGIWDAEYLKPFHQAIRDGFNIMETDRSGTHLKRMKEWMNIDEIAVIRRKDRPTTLSAINEFYAVLLAQHGKTYDFNFDVETTDKLVCSELLYQTYGDVIWPTKSYLGRYTISPDNVAEIIAQKGTPFKLLYSLERNEEEVEIQKDLVALANNLGYSKNGVDDDGELILEKQTLTCMDRIDADGKKLKTCLKTWIRPVFGGKSERRFDR